MTKEQKPRRIMLRYSIFRYDGGSLRLCGATESGARYEIVLVGRSEANIPWMARQPYSYCAERIKAQRAVHSHIAGAIRASSQIVADALKDPQ